MLRSITLENFKSIGRPTTVKFSNITLIYGPNSVGKSSILQALHFAHEVFVNEDLNPDFSKIGNEGIYLGGFENLVHRRDLSRRIKLSFTFDIEDNGTAADHSEYCRAASEGLALPPNLEGIVNKMRMATLESINEYGYPQQLDFPEHFQCGLIPLAKDVKTFSLAFSVSWDSQAKCSKLDYVLVGLDGKKMLVADSFHNAHLFTESFDYFPSIDCDFVAWHEKCIEPVFRDFDKPEKYYPVVDLDEELNIVEFTEEERGKRELEFQRSVEKAKAAWKEFNDDHLEQSSEKSWVDKAKTLFNNMGKEWFHFQQVGIERCLTPHGWNCNEGYLTVEDIREHVHSWPAEVSLAEYELPANYAICVASSIAVTIRQNFIKLLKGILHVGPLRSRSIELNSRSSQPVNRWYSGEAAWQRLYREHCKIDVISEWLKSEERFDSGYEIEKEVSKRVSDLEKFTTDIKLSDDLAFILETLPSEIRIILKDKFGLKLNATEVGTGISQIVPIIVACVEDCGRVNILEQPELHLHPKAQLVIGDLLIDGSGGDRQFIVETHSEHLVLRILRRIRETSEAESCEFKITPAKLAVNYASHSDDGLRIVLLKIDESGEFIDRWPQGFFDERASELF